ncbi:MAG: hypothetical protein ACJ8FY_25255 [Gemmataceae bacterium]
MSFESPSPIKHEPGRGLPPVQAPSGKFIVQLFVVPALIVIGVLIPVVLLVRGCAKSPEELLADLHSANSDVRWRAAEQLAQMMPRDRQEALPRFAFNVKFSLDLTGLLQNSLQEETNLIQQTGARSSAQASKENKSLDEIQKLVRFLVSSLGNFNIPVPAPVLCTVATTDKGLDARTLHERRQLAILALKNLGSNLDDYKALPEERKAGILSDLEEAAKTVDESQQGLARASLAYLRDGKPLGVESALVQCSEAEDPLIREAAALALGFWDGDKGEKALLRLARDNGHGSELAMEKEKDSDPDAVTEEELQKRYQLEVRYHALLSLARRGSSLFPEWMDDFADMLDEDKQLQNFQIKKDGKYVPDQGAAGLIIRNALSVLQVLHQKRPDLDLSKLDPALIKLTESPNYALKEETKQVRKSLGLSQ